MRMKTLCFFKQNNIQEENFWNTLYIDGLTNYSETSKNKIIPNNPKILNVKEEDISLDEILLDFLDEKIDVRLAVFAQDNALYSAIYFKDSTRTGALVDDHFFSDKEFSGNYYPILAIFDKKFFSSEPSRREFQDFFEAATLQTTQTHYLEHQVYVLAILEKTSEELRKRNIIIDENYKKDEKYIKITGVFDNIFGVCSGIDGKTNKFINNIKKKLNLYTIQNSIFKPD